MVWGFRIKHLSYVPLLVFLAILTGCSVDTSSVSEDDLSEEITDDPYQSDPVVECTDSTTCTVLCPIGGLHPCEVLIDSLQSDSLNIISAEVVGDTLQLVVEYLGGCTAHEFTLFISSFVIKTGPPQTEVYLRHYTLEDPCQVPIRALIKFDLSPLKEFQQWRTGKLSGTYVLLLEDYPVNWFLDKSMWYIY